MDSSVGSNKGSGVHDNTEILGPYWIQFYSFVIIKTEKKGLTT